MGSYRILAVDDDDANNRVLKRIFKRDYVIASATSGEEALELIPNYRPDLILLDIMMPGMDGYETCRKIRADKRFSLIKIILVSGRAMVDERLKGYEAGADDYIAKPFNNEELKAKVRVFLRLKRAEEIDQIKGDLITLFSHETKTPLSGIIGISELLKEDQRLDQDARDCADLINKSGRQLLEFVRKTSFLCELRSGTKLNFTCRAPAQHLKDKINAMVSSTSKKDIAIHLEGSEDIEINADWEMLDMVLGYLLDNAVKYSPEGREVVARTDVENGTYRIQISNEGDGIDPEWIDKIFDEFAIRDVMHHQRGQGLSLAISKHIVDLHSGTLEVESSRGNGATFTVSLPFKDVPEEHRESSAQA